MSSPYVQVALTYIRSPFSTWKSTLAYAFAGCVMIPIAFREVRNGIHVCSPASLAPFLVLFVFLGCHMKEQFANSRARLMPGFFRIHATIAGAAVLLCAILLPMAFAWHVGWHPVGFAAITLLLFVAIFWSMLSLSQLIITLALIAWMLLAIEPGRGCVQQLVSGNFEHQALAILAVGVVIAILGGIRLVRLDGDMPEYSGFMWNRASGTIEFIAPRGAQDSIRQGLVFRAEDKLMARLTRHAQRASVSRWSRICRWQAGMMTGWSAVCFCLVSFLFFFLMTWMTNKGALSKIAVPTFLASFMPAGMAWGALWQRRKALPRESLMCVDRATYLKQVGIAAAISQIQLWLGMIAGVVLLWFWVLQQPFSVKVAYVLAFSALSQPCFFGLNAWLLRFRSVISLFLGWLVVLPVFAGATVGIELGPLSSEWPVVLLLAAIFAVFGLVLTWDAYRRWLVADFD